MCKATERALIEAKLASYNKPIVTLHPDAKAYTASEMKAAIRGDLMVAPAQDDHIDPSIAVEIIEDHCGREHAKNAYGEWLY